MPHAKRLGAQASRLLFASESDANYRVREFAEDGARASPRTRAALHALGRRDACAPRRFAFYAHSSVIGTQDLRIAAITLAVGGILLTRNSRDFEQIPNLSWQDWTI